MVIILNFGFYKLNCVDNVEVDIFLVQNFDMIDIEVKGIKDCLIVVEVDIFVLEIS